MTNIQPQAESEENTTIINGEEIALSRDLGLYGPCEVTFSTEPLARGLIVYPGVAVTTPGNRSFINKTDEPITLTDEQITELFFTTIEPDKISLLGLIEITSTDMPTE